PDVLATYDATHPENGAPLVGDATHESFFVTRNAGITGSLEAGDNDVLPTGLTDFAVRDGRVAFAVPEVTQGEDLTGDGQLKNLALLLRERDGTVVNLHQVVLDSEVHIGSRWLLYQAFDPAQLPARTVAVGVRELGPRVTEPFFICSERGGTGRLVTSFSDSLLPCLLMEDSIGRDLNGDH